MKFIVVTGMSGGGKSTAMKMMEDMGFYCIDNLPIPLLDKLIDFSNNFNSDIEKVAIGIDIRNGEGFDKIESTLDLLKKEKFKYEILFIAPLATLLLLPPPIRYNIKIVLLGVGNVPKLLLFIIFIIQ